MEGWFVPNIKFQLARSKGGKQTDTSPAGMQIVFCSPHGAVHVLSSSPAVFPRPSDSRAWATSCKCGEQLGSAGRMKGPPPAPAFLGTVASCAVIKCLLGLGGGAGISQAMSQWKCPFFSSCLHSSHPLSTPHPPAELGSCPLPHRKHTGDYPSAFPQLQSVRCPWRFLPSAFEGLFI